MSQPLLQVQNMKVAFQTKRGLAQAITGVDLEIYPGEKVGIVGESGSGKSVTSMAIMGLLPNNAIIQADTMKFDGQDLQSMTEKQKQDFRGASVGMIFQDPMTSLNPSYTVEYQLVEAIAQHENLTKKQCKARALDLLKQVGIPSPQARMKAYPFQLSGGMSQRVMIAMAIACQPKLLIADEPTTALDVTIQAQILALLDDLVQAKNMALLLITHDIGVVAQNTTRMQVMYAGQVVEKGPTQSLLKKPAHPYTEALFSSLPAHSQNTQSNRRLYSLDGMVPDVIDRPQGCQLHPRCAYAQDACKTDAPNLLPHQDRLVRCYYPLDAKESA
jgi:dipeptide transport system ATP-binding protein